jgi:hypothetical protein
MPQHAAASIITSSSITFSNFQITPSVGTVQFLGPWTAEAFAQSSNSLGELDALFDTTDAGTASVHTSVAHASASSQASAINVTGAASNAINLPGGDEQAVSRAHATLFNFFVITGGTGVVNVDFSVDVSGLLSVSTVGSPAIASADTIFTLELDGTLLTSRFDLLTVGPGNAQSTAFTERLGASVSLPFADPGNLFGSASFAFLAVFVDPFVPRLPEPSTWLLILLGLALLQLTASRRRS